MLAATLAKDTETMAEILKFAHDTETPILHHRACRSILAVFLLAVSLLGCSPDRAAQVREQGETAQQQGVIESGQQGAGQEGQQTAARPQTDGSERKGDVVPGVPGALEKGGDDTPGGGPVLSGRSAGSGSGADGGCLPG